MSELKAILATLHPKMKNACDGAIEVYPKSEADKEIQRLEKLCENYRCDCDNLAIMTDTMRKAGSTLRQKMNHQKYKRCLAMAKWCENSWNDAEIRIHAVKDIFNGTPSDELLFHHEFFRKWYLKWLELAEKFKEAK